MSEYWVSNKRYWCKYCGISIADDVPSRQQHEGGLRHKGNVERFIRNIYKTGEKRKKEAAEEARDMERIEKAAQAAFHNDVGAGHAKMSDSSLPSTSKAPAVKKPAAKPSNPFANYTTAQSLGYTDPEEELAKTRQTQGVVGEWQFIAPTASASPAPEENPVVSDLKRPAEGDEDGRSFKLRKKTVNLGDVYDPGVITIKPRVKKEDHIPSIHVDIAEEGTD
uniref:Matrin-type domain-containing protein n=1 Tax=Schizophyllum commune (strain H4-8 / FGSC 9210) TaxID=578458 RepID=D8Q980_SCHCM